MLHVPNRLRVTEQAGQPVGRLAGWLAGRPAGPAGHSLAQPQKYCCLWCSRRVGDDTYKQVFNWMAKGYNGVTSWPPPPPGRLERMGDDVPYPEEPGENDFEKLMAG